MGYGCALLICSKLALVRGAACITSSAGAMHGACTVQCCTPARTRCSDSAPPQHAYARPQRLYRRVLSVQERNSCMRVQRHPLPRLMLLLQCRPLHPRPCACFNDAWPCWVLPVHCVCTRPACIARRRRQHAASNMQHCSFPSSCVCTCGRVRTHCVCMPLAVLCRACVPPTNMRAAGAAVA